MSLVRGMGMRLAAYGAGGLVSFAALPLLVRHLGPADFGRYVAALSVIGIAALASDLGITGVALREGALSGPERQRLLAGLLGIRVSISIAGAVAAVSFAALAGYRPAAVAGAAVAAVGLLPQGYMEIAVAALIVDARFGAAAAVELARSVTGTLLVAVLVLAGAGLAAFLAAWAGAAAAGALAARVAGGRASTAWPKRPDADVRALLRESAGYSVATVLHVLYFRAVMIVVSLSASAIQAGYFGVAFRISEFVGAGAAQVSASATPTLARATADGTLRSAARRISATTAALGAVAAALLALTAPIVVLALGGHDLEPAAAAVRIQAIAIGLMFVVFSAGATLFTLRRHRALVVANACGLAAAVGCALVLVPAHGARGGATAAVAGEATLLAALALLLAQALRRRSDV